MEALLKQPGFIDEDLPQTMVKDDLVKAAAVVKAIEAFGEIDASKASVASLDAVKSAMISLKFRTNGHDLVARPVDRKNYRTIYIKGIPHEWEVPNGTQERNQKALIETGEAMEEWTKSFIWLLSWENPSLKSEEKVVGMGNWCNLARQVALAFDTRRQWGQNLGFGYGNRDANELAVDVSGGRRVEPTEESRRAAQSYTQWFDKLHLKITGKLRKRQFSFMTTQQRVQKDLDELGTYGGRFWKGKWW